MAELSIDIAGLNFKNPVLTASGTFGYGTEFDDFFDVGTLGGFVVKGTTLHSRQGNKYPRMAETPSGMLNAVGLQNNGVRYFIDHIYPGLLKYNTHIFVNVSGSTVSGPTPSFCRNTPPTGSGRRSPTRATSRRAGCSKPVRTE